MSVSLQLSVSLHHGILPLLSTSVYPNVSLSFATCNARGEKGHPAYIHNAGSKKPASKGSSPSPAKAKDKANKDDSSRSSKGSSKSNKSKDKLVKQVTKTFATLDKTLGTLLEEDSELTDSEEESHSSHFLLASQLAGAWSLGPKIVD